MREVLGGHHVRDVEIDREEICEDDRADDGYDRDGCGKHSKSDTVDDHGGGTCLGSLSKFLGRLVGVGCVVLRCLSDDDTRQKAGHHGAGKLPPVGEAQEPEHHEGGDTAEYRSQVRTDAHGLEELGHAGSFPGANREYADDRQDDTEGRDEHRGKDGPDLHVRTSRIECGSAEGHGREDGSTV